LYEYLIETYTDPNDTIVDLCFGSGTTGVASIRRGRNFIGIEQDKRYFEIGKRRIEQAPQPLFTDTPRPLTPLALDGANAPDFQQSFPADVLDGDGVLPEPPRQ